MQNKFDDPVKSLIGVFNDEPNVGSAIPGLYEEDLPTPELGYEFDPARQITSGFNKT